MPSSGKCGVLMVNTGTPSAPTPRAVRTYLSKFLSHPRIAPMGRIPWGFILHCFILPFRGRSSAKKYVSIWTDEGSPLDCAHRSLVHLLDAELRESGYDAAVRCAMSFGSPTVRESLRALSDEGVERIVVLPLYPQSAYSTTGVVKDDIAAEAERLALGIPCEIIDGYHLEPSYIKAIAASVIKSGFDPDGDDRLLFSFHSIPLTDIESGDTYELQTSSTSLHIAQELGLDRQRWTIGYQCRFDKSRDWLSPTTKDVLERWADAGGGRVFVVCPNFAVDCLETIYDIQQVLGPEYLIRRRAAGHPTDAKSFTYVPCLGGTPLHARVLRHVLAPCF